MSDYKYDIQMLAEEFAETRYNREFYACPDHVQSALYEEATVEYRERQMEEADRLLDQSKDRWVELV